jgi:hypothetical protein
MISNDNFKISFFFEIYSLQRLKSGGSGWGWGKQTGKDRAMAGSNFAVGTCRSTKGSRHKKRRPRKPAHVCTTTPTPPLLSSHQQKSSRIIIKWSRIPKRSRAQVVITKIRHVHQTLGLHEGQEEHPSPSPQASPFALWRSHLIRQSCQCL